MVRIGRVYRTQTFSVDQTTGTVSSASLTSDVWYDATGWHGWHRCQYVDSGCHAFAGATQRQADVMSHRESMRAEQ